MSPGWKATVVTLAIFTVVSICFLAYRIEALEAQAGSGIPSEDVHVSEPAQPLDLPKRRVK